MARRKKGSASRTNCTAKGHRKLQLTDDFGDFLDDFVEHEQLHGSSVGPVVVVVAVGPVVVGFVVVGSVVITMQFNFPVSFK